MKRIVLAGGSGFLGGVLAEYFRKLDYEIVILTRSRHADLPGIRHVVWDGENLGDLAHELDGSDALINLAGLSVNCRYHSRNRRRILDSRLNSTRVLGEAIARCAKPPRVWLNSSTATIYKHTYGPAWDESGEIAGTPEAKDIFSVEVATAWEKVFDAANTPCTRKVLLRSAMVLGRGGNSVFPMLQRLVRLGLGGKMASGRQYVSWIHQTDFCRAVEWLMTRNDISGPVNLAAPNPLPNAEMMRTLREVCGKGLGLPAALWMLEIGAFFLRTETELIIKSRRVIPGRLIKAGFQFRYTFIHDAFKDLHTQ
jgi:uncharacterized protein (TIGR01777 family)